MPFAPKYKQDDQAQSGQSGQGQNISGVSTSFNVPGSGGSSSGASSTPKSSGQYQNLDKYVSANQPQGAQMGQQIASGVESDINKAQQAVGGLTSQVQKTAAYDPMATINRADQLSDEEKKTYKTTKQTGGYTGPSDITGLGGYAEAQTATTRAKEQLGKVGNDLGQKDLFKQTYNRPNYTSGAQNLDQVIMQGSTQGRQAIESLADKYKNLNDQFGQSFTGAQNDISTSLANAKANKAAIAQAEQDSMNNLINPISQRADQFNADSLAKRNSVASDVSDDILNQETLANLGLNEGLSLYDLNLGSYVNYDATPANMNNVATQEERNKYAALQSLFDGADQRLTADGKPINPLGFDKAKFDSDYAASENAANARFKSSIGLGQDSKATTGGPFSSISSDAINFSKYIKATPIDELRSRLGDDFIKKYVFQPGGKFQSLDTANHDQEAMDMARQIYKNADLSSRKIKRG
jgi:hypothetical protein